VRFRIDRFQRAYNIVQLAFSSFLSLVTLLALTRASGVPLGLSRMIHTALGVLLLVLGNFMGKFTRNHAVAIVAGVPWLYSFLLYRRLGGAR
jgi:hypothetical protein